MKKTFSFLGAVALAILLMGSSFEVDPGSGGSSAGGISVHSGLSNLDYNNAGHTGFVSSAGAGISAPDFRTSADVFSKSESQDLAGQSSLRYYFNESADPIIAGYEAFATSPVVMQTSDGPITVNTTLTLIDTWITPANTPNLATFVSGIYDVRGYLDKSSGADITLVMGLWLRTVGNVERQIATSSTQLISGTLTKQAASMQFSVGTATSSAKTDRIVVRLYATRAAGAASTITLYYGAETDSYLSTLISPRNFLRTDGSNPESGILANIGADSAASRSAQVLAHSQAVATHGCSLIASIATNLSVFGIATYSGQIGGASSVASTTALGTLRSDCEASSAARPTFVQCGASVATALAAGGLATYPGLIGGASSVASQAALPNNASFTLFGLAGIAGLASTSGYALVTDGATVSWAAAAGGEKGDNGATGSNILTSISSYSASYTLTLADVGGLIEITTASTDANLVQSVLIPSSATVNFPIGAQINVVRMGVGEVRIAGVSPAVVLSIASPTATPWLLKQYSGCSIVYIGTDTYYVAGHLKDGP